MQSFTTTCSRWLMILFVTGCFASSALAQRTVTLKLNTASIPDTTSTESTIQVRGALIDATDQTLPDGNVIAWDETTTLEATNVGGDFWELSFQIPDTTELRYKFFSTQAEESAAGIGGWEDGISDGTDGNAVIAGGEGDTTLSLHFFNKSGDQPYGWRPYEESTGDSIAVWFRVYANSESAINAGFDRESDSLVVGVRGDDFNQGGPLDWGLSLELSNESDTETAPGYHLFSGVAYYPDSLKGSKQFYKFVFEDRDDLVGWEGTVSDDASGNRFFTIPENDTTLHWVYFDNSAPASGEEQLTSLLIFEVDTSPLEAIGLYDRGRGDSLEVRGEFNGWGCSDTSICQMQRVPGTDLFEGAFSISAFAETNFQYKFFINHNDVNFEAEFGDSPPSGWEEPISTTGANRRFTFGGSDEQVIGLQFFNDVLPGNIVPEGTNIDLTFQVGMDAAIANEAEPFDPATDTVTVALQGDALWAFTQGVKRDSDGNFQVDTGKLVLTDEDGDGLYTGTMTMVGPTYAAIQYKYAYGSNGTFTEEMGGSFDDAGRRRTRYVALNPDGSWPSEWTFVEEDFQPEGLLPFEENPAIGVSVEQISDEVPSKIALEANYPNPFNPVTTIEYSLTATEQVALNVYDLTGRLVATVIDGMQPAGSYRVDFDAQDLASGVYVYRLESASTTITRKMVLLK